MILSPKAIEVACERTILYGFVSICFWVCVCVCLYVDAATVLYRPMKVAMRSFFLNGRLLLLLGYFTFHATPQIRLGWCCVVTTGTESPWPHPPLLQ